MQQAAPNHLIKLGELSQTGFPWLLNGEVLQVQNHPGCGEFVKSLAVEQSNILKFNCGVQTKC